jgi:hypothetical protein
MLPVFRNISLTWALCFRWCFWAWTSLSCSVCDIPLQSILYSTPTFLLLIILNSQRHSAATHPGRLPGPRSFGLPFTADYRLLRPPPHSLGGSASSDGRGTEPTATASCTCLLQRRLLALPILQAQFSARLGAVELERLAGQNHQRTLNNDENTLFNCQLCLKTFPRGIKLYWMELRALWDY